jgi:hypothetical protein
MYIRLLLIVPLFLGVVLPLGLSPPITPRVQRFYDFIETLEPDDIVVCPSGLSFSFAIPDTNGPFIAFYRHMFERGTPFIIVAYGADTGYIHEDRMQETLGVKDIVNDVSEEYPDKKWGVDFIITQTYFGGETSAAAFCRDIPGNVQTDFFGNPWEDFPISEGLETTADFTAVIQLETGNCHIMIRQYGQFGLPYHVILGSGVSGEGWTYIASGLFEGAILGGGDGAAYEKLIGRPGFSALVADPVSLGHLYVLLLLLVGNIAYWMDRLGKGGS